MTFIRDVVLFIVVTGIAYSLDDQKCRQGNDILFIHHVIVIFANFGWLSNTKSVLWLYFFAPLIVVCHWLTNDNRCFLTEWHNQVCHRDRDTMFNDIYMMVGLKNYSWWNDYGHKLYLMAAWLFTIWKLQHIK